MPDLYDSAKKDELDELVDLSRLRFPEGRLARTATVADGWTTVAIALAALVLLAFLVLLLGLLVGTSVRVWEWAI